MFQWLINYRKPILLSVLIWLFPTILSVSLMYGRKEVIYSSDTKVSGISSAFKPTPNDFKFLDKSSVGYESHGHYIYLSDDEWVFMLFTWASSGFYSQMQLTYQHFKIGAQNSSYWNIANCDVNSVEKKLDNLYVKTNCMDFVTSIYSTNVIKYIKFKEDVGILGEIYFSSIDRGVSAWNDKGEFILNPDTGENYKIFFVAMKQVKGNIKFLENGKNVDINGVGIYRVERMGTLPNKLYQRINQFYFKSKEGGIQIFLFQFFPPKSYSSVGANGIGYAFMYKGDSLQFVTSNYNYTLIDGELDQESSYNIPTHMKLNLNSNNGASNININAETDVKLFTGIDALKKFPGIIRTVTQTFVTKPFLMCYIFSSYINYKTDSEMKTIDGTIYMNTNFM